jgi:predicted RNase H-like nuclease (RuvC/YqgF family)
MAKLTLSEAARACNVARTTIQRAVKTGRISLDAEHRVDTAELLRIGYQLDAAVLHAATQQFPMQTQQNAAPQHSTPQQQGAAAQELQLLRQERDALQRERDLLMQQVNMLHTIHQTTQQQLTQAQQMLHEMQHRYDRLLEAPARPLRQGQHQTHNHALQAPPRPLGERCVGALWPCCGSIRRD